MWAWLISHLAIPTDDSRRRSQDEMLGPVVLAILGKNEVLCQRDGRRQGAKAQ